MQGTSDPKLYRELNVPRPASEVEAAAEGFQNELRELRAKYKLPDVYCIVRAVVLNDDGTEGDTMMRFQNGGSLWIVPMTAWAFGFEQSQQKALVSRLSKGAAS